MKKRDKGCHCLALEGILVLGFLRVWEEVGWLFGFFVYLGFCFVYVWSAGFLLLVFFILFLKQIIAFFSIA